MAEFVSGDIVVVPFPFTDLVSVKVRPALVIATLTRGDVILCQITSRPHGHPQVASIQSTDFAEGKLPVDSYALPQRIVTAHTSCIRRTVGRLTTAKLNEIRQQVCAVIRQP